MKVSIALVAKLNENISAGKKSGKYLADWPLPSGDVQSILKAQAPVFADFALFKSWPSIDFYNGLAKPLMHAVPDLLFVEQEVMGKRRKKKLAQNLRTLGLSLADNYVHLIIEKGEIPTRGKNWHDFFNLISWTQFPKMKYQLFSSFYKMMRDQKGASEGRSPEQDRLVVFEEGGLILLVSHDDEETAKSLLAKNTLSYKAELLNQLKQKQVFVFGHGLYESMFASPIPVNAFTILYTVDEEFFSLSLIEKLKQIDEGLAKTVPDSLLQSLGTFPTDLLLQAAF